MNVSVGNMCVCVGSDICSWEMSVSLGCVSVVFVWECLCQYVNVFVCAIYVFQVCVLCVERYVFACICVCVYVSVQGLATE